MCISPVVSYDEDALQKMVKYANKPSEIPEIEEYLPAYDATTHPHLAIYKEINMQTDSKTIKLHN